MPNPAGHNRYTSYLVRLRWHEPGRAYRRQVVGSSPHSATEALDAALEALATSPHQPPALTRAGWLALVDTAMATLRARGRQFSLGSAFTPGMAHQVIVHRPPPRI